MKSINRKCTTFLQFYDGLSNHNRRFLTLSTARDLYKWHYSNDNIITFVMRVTNRVTYSGFQMGFRSIGNFLSEILFVLNMLKFMCLLNSN